MTKYTVQFPGTSHPAVLLEEGEALSEALTIMNSPLLFGCRSGICGTCLIEVTEGMENLEEAESAEKEALEIYAPGNANARLACQVYLNASISIKKIASL